MDSKSAGHRLSFDEFRLYYESKEKVTDRQLETNRWKYSTQARLTLRKNYGTVILF